ncbi:hypothetical protein A5856_000872, partial [Enterococcus faecium]
CYIEKSVYTTAIFSVMINL